jgi:hypothetical protein
LALRFDHRRGGFPVPQSIRILEPCPSLVWWKQLGAVQAISQIGFVGHGFSRDIQ